MVKYWLPGYPCIISFNRHTCHTLLKIIFIFLCFSFPSRSILPRWCIANVLSITRKNLMRTIIVVNHREIDSGKFLSYLINSLHDFYQLNLVISIILFITHYINISYGGDFFYYSWCSLLKNVSLIYTIKFIIEVRISRAFLTDARSHVILLLSRPQILICWRGRSFRRFFYGPLTKSFAGIRNGAAACRCIACRTRKLRTMQHRTDIPVSTNIRTR